MVLLLSDVEPTSIRIIKPIKLGDNEYFGLKYNKGLSSVPFVIQTPFLYIKYRPTIFDSGYVKLDVELCEESKFVLAKIEKYIYDKLTKKYRDKLHNFAFSNNILRIRTMNFKSIQIFDMNKNSLNIHKLCHGDRICVILLIDKYIYNHHKSYINYNILQIQKFVVDVSTNVIRTANIGFEGEDKDGYDKAKYEKMLSLGIPEIAVRQKMQLDGVVDSNINSFFTSKNKGSSCVPGIPPPPPPPPPPPNLFGTPSFKPPGISALFNDIKNGNFALKKANISEDKRNKILKHVDTDRKVPSLHEIQNALKNLRKIN